MQSDIKYRIPLLSIMAVQTALLAWSAAKLAPTWDEVGHLAAGISHWELGDFSQYSVNPPLVRTVAALPVISLMQPELDWQDFTSDPKLRTEVFVGRRLIDNNTERFLQFFRVARWTCIPFVLLGTVACFLWARDLFGSVAGLFAAGAWAFSPMVLGHGALITPDVAAASLGIAAFYALRCWLRDSSWANTGLMAALFSLALLAKATWIVCLVIVPSVWLAWRLVQLRQTQADWNVPRDLRQLGFAALLVVVTLNGFYGFEGSFRRLGDYKFVSTSLAGRVIHDRTLDSGNRFRGSWLEKLPVPVPASFVEGIDVQRHEFEFAERGRWSSYLFGERRVGGWWYYYLAGYAVKEPLPWLLLLLLSAPLMMLGRLPGCSRPEAAALIIPAVVVLAIVSSQTNLSRHLRYALPALPFLFVWTGQYSLLLSKKTVAARWALVPLLIWYVGSAFYYAPHHLSYFNELVGGPAGGHRALDNSNLDWGQDLLYLKEWMEAHPEAEGMRIAYLGCFDPKALGIQYEIPSPYFAHSDAGNTARPSGPEPGWFAVSANYVLGSVTNLPNGRGQFVYFGAPVYDYFSKFQPVDRAGYSIWIYHLGQPEVDQVRRELGLAPLAGES